MNLWHNNRPLIVVAAVAFIIIAADQAVKWWLIAQVDIANAAPIHVTEFFALVMVWNYGVSFGMLSLPDSMMPYFLTALALVICGLLLRLAGRSECRIERIAYAVIIGGALGNVIDRIRYGAVADFFYFHIDDLGWPAFNIADAAIFCGVMVLLIQQFKRPKSTQ